MVLGLQWIVDKITFPSPPSSYSLTSHPELFFIRGPQCGPSQPGVPCMMYSIPQGAPALLIHAHSNGCDIGDMRQTLQSIAEALRVHVMSFEFPGYGLHVGAASMRSIDETARVVLHFLVNDLGVNLAQVVWYGRSIGSGPAIRIAHRITKEHGQQPGGLVLQCGYANFPEVARHLFGRVAKQLVSPLWRNEAMVRELNCPVLLIHGRNDTMIPIEQSEKLWNATAMRDLSHFHICDCGHNNFDFRRCTLRPIYDFLLAVISAPQYPSTNFTIEVPSSSRALVHHIGPLRAKIPVYGFRRPELEEWMRQLEKRCAAGRAGDAALSDAAGGQASASWAPAVDASNDAGDGGAIVPTKADDSSAAIFDPSARGTTEVAGRTASSGTPPVAADAAVAGRTASAGTSSVASVDAVSAGAGQQRPAPKKGAKKGKGDSAEKLQPPMPDFCELPPIEDVSEALLDARGMVRTCALRVARFLERVQRQLDRVEGLEEKPLEEVVELVECEFWSCDPLLCLWEEVELPRGDRVRVRLGPFAVDNFGVRSYDAELGLGTISGGEDVLRVPLWVFLPSAAHFRCLAEWSLLHSCRLERNLPARNRSSKGSGRCVPCRRSRGKSGKSGKSSRKGANANAHPTKGILATSLAAHFVNWVMEKTEEVRNIFTRFAELHQKPEEVLQRLAKERAAVGPPLEPKELPSELLEETTITSTTDMPAGDGDSPPLRDEAAQKAAAEKSAAAVVRPPGGGVPWPPLFFSSSARMLLTEATSTPSPQLLDFLTRLWTAQDGEAAPPGPPSFQAVTQLPAQIADAGIDWVAANVLRHYDMTLGCESEGCKEGCDPLRPELRQAGLAVCKAMKAFANAEHRKRRETERRKLRPAPKLPQQPVAAVEADPVPGTGPGSAGESQPPRFDQMKPKQSAKPPAQEMPGEPMPTEAQLSGAVAGGRGDVGAATATAPCGTSGLVIAGAKGPTITPISRPSGSSGVLVGGPVPQPGRRAVEPPPQP